MSVGWVPVFRCLTLPAVEAVLAFQRQWPKACPHADPTECSGEHCDCPLTPLAEWVTVDDEPTEECETCGGSGGDPESAEALVVGGPGVPTKKCTDCTDGRRPLETGDRVTIVAGEVGSELLPPETWQRITSTKIMDPDGWRRPGDPDWDEPITYRDFQERSMWSTVLRSGTLPAPGTVVGTATVDWVGPIHSSNDDPDHSHITVYDDGEVELWEWHDPPIDDEVHWTSIPITGHEHVDWTPGRWAVRLTIDGDGQ